MNDSYHQQLTLTFRKYFSVSDNVVRKVYEECTIKTFLRNDLIAEEGKTDAFEYFLIDGIFHSYSVSTENEPITTRIFLPQSVITPHIVRTSGGRSLQSMGCLSDAVAAIVPIAKFNQLMNEFRDLHSFGYKVVESELAFKTNREVSLLTLSAKERLLHFRKEYQNLENIIPHTVIAGFLGITPVSFSRLRNELASKK